MDHQNNQNQDMNLVSSIDAKPRLKWTPELHKQFVDAITQLGGPEVATPKSLMKLMSIHGLTLYHLKSHLQKYRLGKIQQSPACSGNMQKDFLDDRASDITSIDSNDEISNQNNESIKIAQALHMQMEVQRKLYEQIEVQRHLQLRIEAQGKYLQLVLKKAQDTLAWYDSSPIKVGVATMKQPTVSDVKYSASKHNLEENPKPKSSLESSLTSFENSGGNEKDDDLGFSSMEMSGISNFGSGRKRSGSTDSNGNHQDKRLRKEWKRFDLNG